MELGLFPHTVLYTQKMMILGRSVKLAGGDRLGGFWGELLGMEYWAIIIDRFLVIPAILLF